MKLSNNEFWAGLRESAGLYARAVRHFKREYGVEISRVGVRDRALKDLDQLNDIREQNQFLRGLFSWVGFEKSYVMYNVEKRLQGKSKYNWKRCIW